MRITHDFLHKIARGTIKQRQRSEPDLQAAYLTGSILDDEPLLGGTTDVDLVLVHKYQVPIARETLAVTPEVSLDIIHKLRDDYVQHKQLRHDPWLGYPLTRNHILLYDTDHWLEFIQAGVSAQFHRADNVLVRVNTLSGRAREGWFELMSLPAEAHLQWLDRYLEILTLAANAVVGLNSPPLTTRRFLMDFQEQTAVLGVPRIHAGLSGLLGIREECHESLPAWQDALKAGLEVLTAQGEAPAHLAECRHAYYLNAIQSLSESGHADDAIWPLLRIWLDVQLASQDEMASNSAWGNMIDVLGLGPDEAETKVEALDAFLDTIEIVIEAWAEEYGI
jgi:hypothetical protein